MPTVDLAVTLAHIRQHCRGREQARKVRDIAAALGLRETQVRLAAQELRNQGYPICATFRQPAGYFWPETPEEIRGALEELRARRDSLSHTIAVLERRFPEQQQARPPRVRPRPVPRFGQAELAL